MSLTFPPAVPLWGSDQLISVLSVRVEDTESGEIENVVLTNRLLVTRRSPLVHANGRRRIPLQVDDWNARGHSKLLGGPLTYRMRSQSIKESYVEAETVQSDYPARMEFSARFDVLVSGEAVASDVEGTAVGRGMTVIPPRAEDTLEVNKPIQFGRFRITAVNCAACRALLTGPQKMMAAMGRRIGFLSMVLDE